MGPTKQVVNKVNFLLMEFFQKFYRILKICKIISAKNMSYTKLSYYQKMNVFFFVNCSSLNLSGE